MCKYNNIGQTNMRLPIELVNKILKYVGNERVVKYDKRRKNYRMCVDVEGRLIRNVANYYKELSIIEKEDSSVKYRQISYNSKKEEGKIKGSMLTIVWREGELVRKLWNRYILREKVGSAELNCWF